MTEFFTERVMIAEEIVEVWPRRLELDAYRERYCLATLRRVLYHEAVADLSGNGRV